MRSKVSFFNRGICRNLLRRCWPLWTAYLVLLLFWLPVRLIRLSRMTGDPGVEYNLLVLRSGTAMIPVSFVMCILTAMVVFSYLYNTRSCGLMNSLPLRRETMFGTAVLTGLMPLLLADLLTAGLTAALYLGRGVGAEEILTWLLMAVCSNLCFYGVAVFCAMLTGSLLILPLAYLALNLAAWVVAACLNDLLGAVVYGYGESGMGWLLWLSPVVALENRVHVSRPEAVGPWQVTGLPVLLAYAAVGLALLIPALLLYRKRNMETATDTVAYPVLKPLFRYCMAFGTALVAASTVYSLLLGGSFHGRHAALVILALLLLGAGLGWYAAEMLIRKTVRVFPGKWKGLAAVCAVLVLLLAAAELDLTGYERRIPKAEEVASVSLEGIGGTRMTQPENIEKALDLHRSVVSHKTRHEPDIHGFGGWLHLRYTLKNGSVLERSYYLQREEPEDPTDVLLWEELLNCPELLDQRNAWPYPVTEDMVFSAVLGCSREGVDGREEYLSFSMTPEEALDFYYNALLPDQRAHTLGRVWLLDHEANRERRSNVSFYMELQDPARDRTGTMPETGIAVKEREYYHVEICMDSEACVRWIREHTDLPIQSQAEQRRLAQDGNS